MRSRQVDKKNTVQVRIDRGWRDLLMALRGRTGATIRSLMEDALTETYGVDSEGNLYRLNDESRT